MNTLTDMPVYMTQVGYQQLLHKLAEKQKEYDQVRDHRQVAFELSGDGWHDNPEFNRMQQMEANLNHTMKMLTDRLDMMKIIEISDAMRNCHQVEIGSIVHLRRYDLADDSVQDECWEIRGFDETNIPQRHLAYNAPLASKIMHLQVGDIAEEVRIGSRHFEIEVIQLFPNRISAMLSN
ncbi:GreA/GreB family elongation factor [Acinetobacter sp. NIPH 1869]|uniref:GreA/GreB family elongation factor n=1 Tax=Acinetobacter higginsii TaxID=70347 RepID=UPI001F4B21CD|nr:GreA/GreB family elongation factor [Acinetobacter higginsii]MCH7306281.1 GreA/GreB family elongation factor [Acinetobacter higginsii]